MGQGDVNTRDCITYVRIIKEYAKPTIPTTSGDLLKCFWSKYVVPSIGGRDGTGEWRQGGFEDVITSATVIIVYIVILLYIYIFVHLLNSNIIS